MLRVFDSLISFGRVHMVKAQPAPRSAAPAPIPPPCEDSPYAEGGRAAADPGNRQPLPATWLTAPACRPARFASDKPRYVRAFAAAAPDGKLPTHVRATRARVFLAVHDALTADRHPAPPRRLRRALGLLRARYDFDDLSCAYDRGLLARVREAASAHDGRVRAAAARYAAKQLAPADMPPARPWPAPESFADDLVRAVFAAD